MTDYEVTCMIEFERLCEERRQMQERTNLWHGIGFGLLVSLPLWAMLIWDWCRGMIQ